MQVVNIYIFAGNVVFKLLGYGSAKLPLFIFVMWIGYCL